MPIEGAVVDVDGTVLRGDEVIEGAREGLGALRDAGVRVVFTSNNPTLTSDGLLRRLADAGIDAEHAVTSASLTARYVSEKYPGATTHVLGEEAVVEALRGEGVEVVEAEDVEVAVVSIDRSLTYDKIRRFADIARETTAYVSTDPDSVIPTDDGRIPGTGTVEAAVSRAAGREPVTVGKPSPLAAEKSLELLGTSPEETLFLGDRLDTDVALGESVDGATAAVLTGVTDEVDITETGHSPDHVLPSLSKLKDLL